MSKFFKALRVAGYVASIFFEAVDFQPILDAEWFALPAFVRPEI